VCIEEELVRICIAEALSNARKYSEPGRMIKLRACFEGHVEDDCHETGQLHIEVDNINKAGMATLSDEQCRRVFEKGYTTHTASASSDGLGLDSVSNVMMAAEGTAWMSVTHDAADDTEHTVLHLRLPASRMPDADDQLVCDVAVDAASSAMSSSKECSDDPNAASDSGKKLACAGLDDVEVSRMLMDALFEEFLNADQERIYTLGGTTAEQRSFVDVALGRLDAKLNPLTPPLPHVDVVMLDQNINTQEGQQHLLGSDIAGQLQAHGYRGVTCIQTGSSMQMIDELAGMPGVDLVFPKGLALSAVADRIRAVLVANKQRTPSARETSP
jgi:hypothetical protein